MKVFSWLYARMMNWASHSHAKYYLAMVSFAESSFFPIPPDVMLIPMSLAHPQKALKYAGLTTFFSILGGIFGYWIGWLMVQSFYPWLMASSYKESFVLVESWFQHWGVWVVIIAGFSPIPYKIFTISAGFLSMPFLPFVIASTLGRGGRFFLVAILLYKYGHLIELKLKQYIDWISWIVILLLVMAYLLSKTTLFY